MGAGDGGASAPWGGGGGGGGLPRWLTRLNVFVLCKFLRLLGNVMALLVLGIVGFVWYAVVPAVYGPMLLQPPPARAFGAALLVVAFSAVVAALLWAYFAAVLTDPGGVPPGWHPFADDAAAARELQLLQCAPERYSARDHRGRNNTGGGGDDGGRAPPDPRRPRFCKHCQAWKPPRAHHCSVAGRCVLKMDHYCVWVVNTVGLLNYKAFLLFLLYTFVASVFALAALIGPMLSFFGGNPSGRSAVCFIAVVLCGAFAASLAGFLVMHGNMVAANCTTIEMYEKARPSPWPFNRGARRNFEEVLGRGRWRWLVPTYSRDERRRLLDAALSDSTRPLQQQGGSDDVAGGGGSGGGGGGRAALLQPSSTSSLAALGGDDAV